MNYVTMSLPILICYHWLPNIPQRFSPNGAKKGGFFLKPFSALRLPLAGSCTRGVMVALIVLCSL